MPRTDDDLFFDEIDAEFEEYAAINPQLTTEELAEEKLFADRMLGRKGE